MKRVAKAKILVTRFPYSSRFGGEEWHSLRLMQGLDKKGYEVQFIGSCPILLKEFKKRGFDVKKTWLGKPPVTKIWLGLFTLLSPILFIKAGWNLWRAKKKWGIDTVYMLSFGEKLLMSPWARIMGLKMLWLEHARIGNWLRKNPWKIVYSSFSKWATTAVTSKAMVNELSGLVKGEIHATPCAVLVDKAEPLPKKIERFMKSGFSVVTVARLTVDKGVDMVAKLVHSKPDMRLVIVGDGPLKETILDMPNQDQILVVDSLKRGPLMSLYKQADLFILGSTKMDPFGMVAAEAMWIGCPTIVTDVCGISSELTDGKDLVVVKPKFAPLDKAVKKLMKDDQLRNKIEKVGQSSIKKNYREAMMIKAFEALLR